MGHTGRPNAIGVLVRDSLSIRAPTSPFPTSPDSLGLDSAVQALQRIDIVEVRSSLVPLPSP